MTFKERLKKLHTHVFDLNNGGKCACGKEFPVKSFNRGSTVSIWDLTMFMISVVNILGSFMFLKIIIINNNILAGEGNKLFTDGNIATFTVLIMSALIANVVMLYASGTRSFKVKK